MSEVTLRGFGWRHAGRRAWAIRDLDLHVAHGERVLLLGPSGAGKSTLLAALAGLLPEDSGEAAGTVEIGGPDPRAGILFQDPQTQLVMARAGDDVAFGLENLGVPAGEIWPRVSDALDRTGFPYPITRPTSALSGGEAQRLALAGVLALRPGLLLLDEPTANLDPAGAALVRDSLTRTRDPDTTMILVEHRVAEALPLVDRVVVLEPGGGVRADGPPSLVFDLDGPNQPGQRLAAAGVWVPGHPITPRKAVLSPGLPLVRAESATLSPRLPPTTVSCAEGEILAVTGPNGAGKSTLALILGGLLKPTSGSVQLQSGSPGGHPHRGSPPGLPLPGQDPWSLRAPDLSRRVGSVFQNPEHQFVTSRVIDELMLTNPPRARVDDLLDRLRLTHLAQANPFTLSGGEARRLSVATALAGAPRLLILDEPTFGQDRRTWIELADLLDSLRADGHGIVAVTHDDEFVACVVDRVHRLDLASLAGNL